MKFLVLPSVLSFLAATSTAAPPKALDVDILSHLASSTAPQPKGLERRWEAGTCSVHLSIEYPFDKDAMWDVNASVYDNAGTLTGEAAFPRTFINNYNGVYGAKDVGLNDRLWMMAWHNNTANVALMQYEQVIIMTGAPGTTSHSTETEAGPWACENGLLVDGYKVESTCTFAC
ncbi:unnamed protein product [Clonostachys solani]|uniref:Uncharacterized protein n=1 Tax=Clonostachys solani TaxID=160281 RepID=A0A9N9ZAY5_9HYPO|nr:unnamed protein product [Clonostachys solani]